MIKLFGNDHLRKLLTFVTPNNVLFDPSDINVTVFDPQGAVADTLTVADLTHESTGKYLLSWQLPADPERGNWKVAYAAENDEGEQATFTFSFNVTPHPYGELANIKVLVGVKQEEFYADEDLERFMRQATGFIDGVLSKYVADGVLPFAVVPEQVGFAAEYYAAALYLMRNALDEKPHPYMQLAQTAVKEYMVDIRKPPIYFSNRT